MKKIRIFLQVLILALVLPFSAALAQNPFCAPTGKGLVIGSSAIDAGALIPGFHCPTAGPGDGKCVPWLGSAPDIGACEFQLAQVIGSYSVGMSQATVATGANISGTWTVSGTIPSAKDWIGLYKVGDPDRTFDSTKWVYTNGATSGTFTTTAPSVDGQYEFRYLVNDGFVSNAKSPTVTVSAAVVPVPGLVTATVTINGELRTYRVYVPAGMPSGPRPTIFAFHGGGQADRWVNTSQLIPQADADKWIVVFPAGATSRAALWQHGLQPSLEGADDMVFVQTLMATLPAKYPIDTNRLYAFGGSNGGMFAHRVMCEMSPNFLGVATGLASMTSWLASRCAPTVPRPVFLIHGDADSTTPYGGGIAGKDAIMTGPVIGAAKTAELFASKNKCSTTPVDTTATGSPTIITHAYGNCANPVSLRQVVGGGHDWFNYQNLNVATVWSWFKAIPLVLPPPQNAAPIVAAGPDMTITLPAAVNLNGTATDDGLPVGSKLTLQWSKVSGPGTVTFANPTAAVTTASFSAAGSYVLNLSASDGAVTVSDDVFVLVNPASVPVVKEFNVTTTLKSLTIARRSNQTVGKVTLPTDMKVKCNGNEASMTATTVTCP